MKLISTLFAFAVCGLSSLTLVGCGNSDDATQARDQHSESEVATNRVAIPSSVRANLGISFVTVERRRIEQTLRVPGRFEYLPNAHREYRTMLPGRVELLVSQFDRVEAGAPLYRIDSPAWRDMQQQLTEAGSSIDRFFSRKLSFEPLWAAHERHEQSLDDSIGVWSERIAQLESLRLAGGGRIDELTSARSALASAQAELASVQEKQAELVAARSETRALLAAAQSRSDYLLDSAGAIVGLDRAQLIEPVLENGSDKPRWATISSIDVVATEPGVIETLVLTNGAWADQEATVMSVVRPERLRFRASGLQSDLGVLRDGLGARIVPPTPTASGRAVPLQSTMEGTLTLGLAGDADDRTIDLFVTPDALLPWARAGVSAQLEIVTDASAAPEMAIPLAAVQRDGLVSVIFRRAPNNQNEAIRLEADLGSDDGRWIAVHSGLRDGDEIVLDGAFQLMLATSGSIQKGGHFHADGTFHEGED
jgi:hypothetical protein